MFGNSAIVVFGALRVKTSSSLFTQIFNLDCLAQQIGSSLKVPQPCENLEDTVF